MREDIYALIGGHGEALRDGLVMGIRSHGVLSIATGIGLPVQ